jgi:hypothetical protein
MQLGIGLGGFFILPLPNDSFRLQQAAQPYLESIGPQDW